MPTSLKDFEAVFPRLAADLASHSKQYGLPDNAQSWFEKSVSYNTLGGKCNRGLSVPDSVALLKPSTSAPASDPSSPDHFPSCTLGWMIELLQAFFLVSDDIMDESHTRRGQPCWYRLPAVGTVAINDAFMLESAIFILLKKHFKTHPDYVEMMELFHEVSFQTECGQLCDLLTAPEEDVDLNRFSMDKFLFIVRYKTAFYSFYLPVALALHYCHMATAKNLKQAHDILIPMGEYFQAQDDFLDCYADPETLGKIGTDIQDNKCSWLVNQGLKKANPEQRKVLDDNYGQKDKDSEAKVKAVYNEMKLDEDYKQYEEDRVGEIRKMIAAVDEGEGLKKELFEVFLSKIYKRSK